MGKNRVTKLLLFFPYPLSAKHGISWPSTAAVTSAHKPMENSPSMCALKPPLMDFQSPCLITRGYRFLLDGVSCNLEPIAMRDHSAIIFQHKEIAEQEVDEKFGQMPQLSMFF